MATALERLKANAAKAAGQPAPQAAAPVAQAAPATPPPAPAATTPAEQLAAQAAAQPLPAAPAAAPAAPPVINQVAAAPATIPAPATTVARTELVPTQATPAASAPLAPLPGTVSLPAVIESKQDARNALAALLNVSSMVSDTKINEALAQLDGPGVSLKQPFARCKSGNWQVLKTVDPKIYDFMPTGDRTYTAIYCGYRWAVVGWKGEPPVAGGGSPPAFKYVIPDTFYHPEYADVLVGTLHIANRIQFTKGEQRVKFDPVGRIAPELQLLVWTPHTGFIVLISSNYSPSKMTYDQMRDVTKIAPSLPYNFSLENDVVVNKKAPEGAKNKTWDNWWIKATSELTVKGKAMRDEFVASTERDDITMAKEITDFVHGADFEGGMSLEEIATKLLEYDPILKSK